MNLLPAVLCQCQNQELLLISAVLILLHINPFLHLLKCFISMKYAYTYKHSQSFTHWRCWCISLETILAINFIFLPTHLTASPNLHTSHAPGQHMQPEYTTGMKIKLIKGTVLTSVYITNGTLIFEDKVCYVKLIGIQQDQDNYILYMKYALCNHK